MNFSCQHNRTFGQVAVKLLYNLYCVLGYHMLLLHSPCLSYIRLLSAKPLWTALKSLLFFPLLTTIMIVTITNSVSTIATMIAATTPTIIKVGKERTSGVTVMKLSTVVVTVSLLIILLGVLDPVLSGTDAASGGISVRSSSPLIGGGVGCVVAIEGSEGHGNVTKGIEIRNKRGFLIIMVFLLTWFLINVVSYYRGFLINVVFLLS